MLADVIAEYTNIGHWRWVADCEPVPGNKDNPPDFVPGGHWEYQPSLREAFEQRSVLYDLVNDKAKLLR